MCYKYCKRGKMRRKRVVGIIFIGIIGLFLFSIPVEARRVKISQYSSITLERIFEIWSGKIFTTVFSEVYEAVRDMSIEETNGYILHRLNEMVEKDSLTDEEAAFLIVALKQEASLLGWSGEEKEFLTKAVLPLSISLEEDIGHFLIQHLLWFFNYRGAKAGGGFKVIGHELKEQRGNVLFHGTLLGLVLTAINQDGMFGGDERTEFTISFSHAEGWAMLESRNDTSGTADSRDTCGLDELNRYMNPDIQRMPDKFTPIVLAFKTSILDLPFEKGKTIQRVLGKVSLNYLTYECKKLLVQTLGLKEVKPWMDEEWRRIIQGMR